MLQNSILGFLEIILAQLKQTSLEARIAKAVKKHNYVKY